MTYKRDAINREDGDVTLIRRRHNLERTTFIRLMTCCHEISHRKMTLWKAK